MAYNKRTWLGRQGTGLNKFSIGGASPVTIVNQPDSVTQVGDALSAGNLNDLEDRIEDAFDDVDTALDTKADEQDVTDLNNALTAIDHRLDNLEQPKGGYVVSNYKDGSITPSGKGNWAVVEGLRGVSRVENMLFKTSASKSRGGISCTNVDGTLTLSGVATSTYAEIFDTMQIVANHSYLVFFADVVNPNAISFNVGSLNTTVKSYLGTPKVVTSLSGRDNSGMGIESYTSGTNFNGISFKFFIRDLNVYFGTSDLSFLGADDSAKLATIQTNYPHLLTPSEYGVRIVDSSYSGVRAKGVNIWNEKWELGYIGTDGNLINASDRIRSEDFIPVTPSTTYYVKKVSSQTVYLRYYDADGNFIDYYNQSGNATEFQTPSGCFYVKFYYWATTYGNDFQICLNSLPDTIKTVYHPYMENTLSLTFQGKSAGSVYDQLETNAEIVQEIDGQKVTIYKKRETQRTYSVDLSTLNWTLFSDYGEYWATQDLANIIKKGFDRYTPANILCEKYPRCLSLNDFISSAHQSDTDTCGSNGTNGAFFIRNGSNTVTPTGYAIIERDEYIVTLSDPIIDNTLLTEAGGRMATVQTGTVVDGSFDMGFITL